MSTLRHSIERAKERYGLELNAFDLGVLRELIAIGHAVLMSRGDNGRHIYLLRYRETMLKLVFCELSKQIITILPPSGRLRKQDRKPRRKPMRKNARIRKGGRVSRFSAISWVGA